MNVQSAIRLYRASHLGVKPWVHLQPKSALERVYAKRHQTANLASMPHLLHRQNYQRQEGSLRSFTH